eukprot:c29254_g1_i1 orf=262-2913(+)
MAPYVDVFTSSAICTSASFKHYGDFEAKILTFHSCHQHNCSIGLWRDKNRWSLSALRKQLWGGSIDYGANRTTRRFVQLRIVAKGVDTEMRYFKNGRTFRGSAKAETSRRVNCSEGGNEIGCCQHPSPKLDVTASYQIDLHVEQDRLWDASSSSLELGESNMGEMNSSHMSSGNSQICSQICRRHLLFGAVASGTALCVTFQPRIAEAESKTSSSETVHTSVSEPTTRNSNGSRIYDATLLGEPVAVGEDKGRVWQKLLAARVVYLGEAESVPDPDDKVLELEIVSTLRDKCFEQQRPISLAMQAFPCTLQPQLNQYMNKRLMDDQLRAFLTHWPDARWQEYQPLLHYCHNNGVRLIACGTPPEVLRTIQAKGVQGLDKSDRLKYTSPAGNAFGWQSSHKSQPLSLADILPNASAPFGPGPYQFAQSRMAEDYTVSESIGRAMADGGSVGLLVVIVGSSHVAFGPKGSGIPARVSKTLQKKTQAIVLLNPERQRIRKEGDVPVADFLWYSATKPCMRNCFDRVEVARVMDAAGRNRDALPKDMQTGLDLGLVSPKVLKDFFDLEQQPFVAGLSQNFQGFRERWLADPRFLKRLAIEETISITTTLMAQYGRRKERFLMELDYVVTDTLRAAIVDFFTVWLPAPTISFHSLDREPTAVGTLQGLNGLLGLFPENAFQRATAAENWDFKVRLGAVVIGGLKLFFVGFISSLGMVSSANMFLNWRQGSIPKFKTSSNKRSPVLKTALVYASFLGISSNLRYQVIAGIVEHWIADYCLASYPLVGDMLSFIARTANCYWGAQQWVDLARITGLQEHQKVESPARAVQMEAIPEMPCDRFEPNSSSLERIADSCVATQSSWNALRKESDVPGPIEDDNSEEKCSMHIK